MSVEFRDLSEQVLRELGDAVKARGAEIAKATGTTINFTLASTNVPAMATSGIQAAIGRAAAAASLNTMRLPSGAGHDAQQIAQAVPDGHDLRAERRRHQPLAEGADDLGQTARTARTSC